MRQSTVTLALAALLVSTGAWAQTQPASPAPQRQRSNRPVVIPPPTIRTNLPVLGVECSPFEPQWAPIYNGIYFGPVWGWGTTWPGWWYSGACSGGICGPGLLVDARSTAVTFGLDWVRVDPALGFQSLSQYWPGRIWGPPLAERDRRINPADADLPSTVTAQPPLPPPPPPPSFQSVALDALRSGDFARAAPMFEQLAQNQADAERAALTAPPPDRAALRLYAIALAAIGRFDEAAVAMRRADAEDSSLRTTPINAAEVLGGAAALRRIVSNAVFYANRRNTPEAWRLVGHLMAAEGRLPDAQRMFDRADALEAQSPAPASQGLIR